MPLSKLTPRKISTSFHGLSEGQVLQRVSPKGANLTLTGACLNLGRIVATISSSGEALTGWKARRVGEAVDGKLMARLTGIPAGGPYKLELRIGEKCVVRVGSFFVGDVWLLAGQSNMQGCGDMEGSTKPHPLIRTFSMRRKWRLATEPLHLLDESPDFCHSPRQCAAAQGEVLRRNAVKGSGLGIDFAREMLKRSGVPQGLICTAHGGTSMNQWAPSPKGGASLYGSMLLSMEATGQPVAGMLWYQGESDAAPQEALHYEQRMKKLVAAVRRDLSQPGLPWVMVQIARFHGLRTKEDDQAWNYIQELQRLLPKKIKNLETVSAIDLPLDDIVHIGVAGHPRLALRVARAAARLVYGDRREKRPPQFKAILKPVNNCDTGWTLNVAFTDVVGGLRATGEAHGFSIVDNEGNDQRSIYKTTLHGDVARLHLSGVPVIPGHYLAYSHGAMAFCNITDGRDEALLAFGPIPLSNKPAVLFPFIRKWNVTGVIQSKTSFAKIAGPRLATRGSVVKTYETDFIDEHSQWVQFTDGHACFSSRIKLTEPMRLDFLMGYDGPFCLWINEKLFFQDLKGTNPALADQAHRLISLPAGTHKLCIAMDGNCGQAWGFFLRMRRTDVSHTQIASGDFAKPVYLV